MCRQDAHRVMLFLNTSPSTMLNTAYVMHNIVSLDHALQIVEYSIVCGHKIVILKHIYTKAA